MVVMEMATMIRSIMTGPSPIIPLREMGNGSYTFDHPAWGTDTLTILTVFGLAAKANGTPSMKACSLNDLAAHRLGLDAFSHLPHMTPLIKTDRGTGPRCNLRLM